MEKRVSVFERISSWIVAIAFGVIGLFFIILSLTFLPVIGIVVATPIMAFSLHFWKIGDRRASGYPVPAASRSTGELTQPD